jgi:hypothetical protein
MGDMTVSKATETKWREQVQAWRTSGESARAFAEKRGLAVSTLRHWGYRLGRPPAPKFLQLVPKVASTHVDSSVPDVVVEVGAARVRVAAGFDATLLADVVAALGRDGR